MKLNKTLTSKSNLSKTNFVKTKNEKLDELKRRPRPSYKNLKGS